MTPRLRKFAVLILLALLACEAVPLGLRLSISRYSYYSLGDIPHAEIALVPGASVIAGKPSPILAERADAAKALYVAGTVQKIFITGDSRFRSYDEVEPVRTYLISAGVQESDILLDRDGVDTYTSMYHAKERFGTSSIIIVTQDFHLPRALFIARSLGMNAVGVAAGNSGGSLSDYLREVPASIKALLDVLSHRTP